jgi:hypothetical protein
MIPYLLAIAGGYLIGSATDKQLFAKGGSTLLAPNGKPSNLTPEQYKLVRTPKFKAWFGDWENDPENASKVVDINGEPLVVYHGTDNIFFEFDKKEQKESFLGRGFYLTKYLEYAETHGKFIIPCFVNILKPLVLGKFGHLINNGNIEEGVIYSDRIVVCREPNQIKLADGTNTTFDAENPDIRFKKGGSTLLAPNGKPSNLTHEQYNLVRTPEFKAWFGDWENDPENASKVADENGEPLVCYHGTQNYGFTNFDKKLQGQRDRGDFGKGFYFTPSKNYALSYTTTESLWNQGYVGNVNKLYQVFLSIKTPYLQNASFFISGIDQNKFDGILVYVNRYEIPFGSVKNLVEVVAFEPNQIKLADGTNTTFDVENPDIRFAKGGETDDNRETYQKWKSLVNMSKSELKRFYDSDEGKEAGLSSGEAKSLGIDSGRESARWIMKMKDTPVSEWSPTMWKWAKKQISFISRMRGNKGKLYDENGKKTRKHTSLLIWGHNPENFQF